MRYPGVDVRQASAEALPFADGSFDVALAQLVVHFMADPIAGLAEMGRVTRRGGVVAACVWDHAGGLRPARALLGCGPDARPDRDRRIAPGRRAPGSPGRTVRRPPACATSPRRRSAPTSSTPASRPGGRRSPRASARPARTWRAWIRPSGRAARALSARLPSGRSSPRPGRGRPAAWCGAAQPAAAVGRRAAARPARRPAGPVSGE